MQAAIFATEAGNYGVVKPKITLTPITEDEFSTFKISEDELTFSEIKNYVELKDLLKF